jgi:hypothetical protein
MTFLSHLHPNFQSVFSIEAANEPIMNATMTPGYGGCKPLSIFRSVFELCSLISLVVQKNFVEVVRATELLLGISVPGVPALQSHQASSISDLSGRLTEACNGDGSGLFNTESAVVQALAAAIPILVQLELELGFLDLAACEGRSPLTTKWGVFMFSFVRHADDEADSASWISSGSTITLQTLQMPLLALSRMTIICTIGWLRFLLTSPQPDPFL